MSSQRQQAQIDGLQRANDDMDIDDTAGNAVDDQSSAMCLNEPFTERMREQNVYYSRI